MTVWHQMSHHQTRLRRRSRLASNGIPLSPLREAILPPASLCRKRWSLPVSTLCVWGFLHDLDILRPNRKDNVPAGERWALRR